jgi:hypothetical protein
MSAVCPACGVAVVPGYVKCPKCHAALPYARSTPGVGAGGTAVRETGFPIVAIVVPIAIVLAFVLLFGLRGGESDDEPPAVEEAAQPVRPPASPSQPNPQPVAIEAPAPAAPDPSAAIGELDRTLRRQRLWSTIDVRGSRIDVRSAACSSAAMGPAIDSTVAVLRDVGLTELRCLSQSGAVVFQRNL